MSRLRSVLFVCIASFCAFSSLCAEPVIVESGPANISADDLISRMQVASVVPFQNAVGYYVVRQYAKKDATKNAAEIEEIRRLLEKSLKERIANDKKFGVKTDVEKLKKENAQALADIEKTKEETISEVVRYTVEGGKYRIERTAVSNTEPLEKIRQDVLAGIIDLKNPHVLVWDGKTTAEIVALSSSSIPTIDTPPNDNNAKVRSSVSYEQIAQAPDFMEYGRDIKDKRIFDPFKNKNLPFSTVAVTLDGELGVLLRIGDKNSVVLSIDTCALPNKGYVVASARVKANGAIMAEDSYRDFVKVNDGSWLPTHITKTNCSITPQGVPYVSTKKELLAIEPPKINAKLASDIFDLANTKEFQSLTPLFGKPVANQNNGEENGKSNWLGFRLFLFFLGLILIVFGIRGKWKAYRNGKMGFFLVATALSLSVTIGCQHSKSSAVENRTKFDIVLTESGVKINHPNGKIPIMAPVGMGIEKKLSITSECSRTIDAMTLTTTCGCSEAWLAESALAPGKSTTISLAFQPEKELLKNSVAVNVLIRHAAEPQKPFIIPLVYFNTEEMDKLQIEANPQSVVVDSICTPELVVNEQITLRLGTEIETGDLSVLSEPEFSKTEMANDEHDNKKKIVNVKLLNPPSGTMNEKIRVGFSKNSGTLYKDIPLTGRILSPFYCEPSSVTLSEENSTEPAFAEINVFKRITSMEFPSIEVTGDWKLDKKTETSDTQLTLRVVVNPKDDGSVSYGMVKLLEPKTGSVLHIPLTLSRVNVHAQKTF